MCVSVQVCECMFVCVCVCVCVAPPAVSDAALSIDGPVVRTSFNLSLVNMYGYSVYAQSVPAWAAVNMTVMVRESCMTIYATHCTCSRFFVWPPRRVAQLIAIACSIKCCHVASLHDGHDVCHDVCIRLCLAMQSTTNPIDPLLQSLRQRNLLLPPRSCLPFNTAFNVTPPPQHTEPLAPLWLTADTASFVSALSQATNQFSTPSPLVRKTRSMIPCSLSIAYLL